MASPLKAEHASDEAVKYIAKQSGTGDVIFRGGRTAKISFMGGDSKKTLGGYDVNGVVIEYNTGTRVQVSHGFNDAGKPVDGQVRVRDLKNGAAITPAVAEQALKDTQAILQHRDTPTVANKSPDSITKNTVPESLKNFATAVQQRLESPPPAAAPPAPNIPVPGR